MATEIFMPVRVVLCVRVGDRPLLTAIRRENKMFVPSAPYWGNPRGGLSKAVAIAGRWR